MVRRFLPSLLSTLAGGFITIGALFSTLIATGTENEGLTRLLEGFGFSAGFFLVVLTGTLLFTEVNVEMPATLFGSGWSALSPRVARLWLLAAVGNMIGALVTGLAPPRSPRTTPRDLVSSWPRSSTPRCATARWAVSRAGSRPCCPVCSATGWSAWPRSWR
jgi:formate/nitrite transporter FocA (FNT family)